MTFIDTARIFVRGGEGGDGCLSMHREKFVPFGGPDGGNGGKGGDVWFVADANLSTLLDFSRHPHIFGKDGENGQGSNCYGRGGEDMVFRVPVGTVVLKGGRVVGDLVRPGERLLAARGGRGGRGNAAFKSNRNKAPRIAEKGEPGESFELELELKLLADVGLAGLPNAGKSTVLARVSNARPKIADYPFTTLAPNLGLVSHRGKSFVLADIPGLIEGAHRGRGLGSAFLRHIERTRVLVHLVDPMGFGGAAPFHNVKTIEQEFASFGHGLAVKPKILAVTKADLPGADKVHRDLARRLGRRGPVHLVSGVTGAGMQGLLDAVLKALRDAPDPPPAPVETPEPAGFRMEGLDVESLGEGLFDIRGEEAERLARMTNFGQPEAVRRFQNILKVMGVERRLKALGVRTGDSVRLGGIEFGWGEAPPPRGRDLPRRKPRPAQPR